MKSLKFVPKCMDLLISDNNCGFPRTKLGWRNSHQLGFCKDSDLTLRKPSKIKIQNNKLMRKQLT